MGGDRQGDNQRSPTCARWVAKEHKTHATPESYASTSPLEALRVVLSEVATGNRGEKVVARVDVRKTYFSAPSRRRVFVEETPENYLAGDEHMCGLLQYSLHRHSAIPKLTRRSACPCVWKDCIKGEHMVATVHGDDITVGGERSAVEHPIQMTSRTYDIKKQVIGEDPDLQKMGRILNRVI